MSTSHRTIAVGDLPIRYRDILRFYLPLVLTSQMMTLSGPVINVGVGRSDDPILNFAGYWLGFSILLFLESPCLVVQQIAATLLTGYHSLKRLLAAALLAGALASAAVLVVALTPVGDLVFQTLVPTTTRVAELARKVMVIQSPIPILICLRGVVNGLAIRDRRTALVARATVVRILSLSAVVGLGIYLGTGSGALAGAWAILTGIALETVIITFSAYPLALRRYRERMTLDPRLTYKVVFRVSIPLVVAGTVWTGTRPVVNAILGILPDPEAAQAGFGIILPLMLVTCSSLWIIQNVSLVLPQTRADMKKVLRFGAVTAGIFSVGILLLAGTPLRDLVLRHAFGLSPELEAEVAPAFLLISIEPILLGARSLAQGFLMKAKRTEPLLIFSPVKLLLIAAVGFPIAIQFPHINGTLLGTILVLGGDLFEAIIYSAKVRSLIREGVLFPERTRAALPG